MSTGPLLQSVEELDSLSAIKRTPGVTQGHDARFLELRTDTGLLYVNPSGWQRVRLRWAFRHFHILPSQLLSRQDQRLIESLLRSARVTPRLPVPRSTVLGVVENVVFTEGAEMSPAKPAEGKWVPPAVSLPHWWPAGVSAISVCLLFALVSAYAHRFFTGTGRVGKPAAISEPAGPPSAQAVVGAVRAVVQIPAPTFPELNVPSRDAQVVGEASRHLRLSALAVMEPEPAAVPTELSPPSANVQRIYVTQLPQEHLVRPVLSDRRLAGEVQLRALISADGSVKEVALVSGEPKLAVPAMQAVRRWHYAQNQLPGPDAEGETLIRMNFFGQDAVSMTTVAK